MTGPDTTAHSGVNGISNGMSYDDVVKVLGASSSSSESGKDKLCTWTCPGATSHHVTVTFTDDKVTSFSST
ncbi:hypothetical protein GGI05_001559 [Coemansia sp. RSA 2603]|nr:hypothetical protein GGI05_001559 [Coemansia sp. RSA 2603]